MALAVKNVPVEEVTLEISFDGKAYEKQVSFTAKAGRWLALRMECLLIIIMRLRMREMDL